MIIPSIFVTIAESWRVPWQRLGDTVSDRVSIVFWQIYSGDWDQVHHSDGHPVDVCGWAIAILLWRDGLHTDVWNTQR